ncbi:response regulator transcription factor [Planctomycetaceae bacterium SH139]
MKIAAPQEAIAYVLDDDPVFCQSVAALAFSINLRCESIDYVNDDSACSRLRRPGCLILDHRLGDTLDGLTVLRELKEGASAITTIVCSGYATTALAVAYLQAGALTVVEKPAAPQVLSQWMHQAINLDRQQLAAESRVKSLIETYNHLTRRQRQILSFLMQGRSNKWIAIRLDVSRRTVEMDRAKILHQFNTGNMIELSSIVTEALVAAQHLGIPVADQIDKLSLSDGRSESFSEAFYGPFRGPHHRRDTNSM